MNNIALNNNKQAPCLCYTQIEKKGEERLNVQSSKIMFQLIRLITDTFLMSYPSTDRPRMHEYSAPFWYRNILMVILCLNHDRRREKIWMNSLSGALCRMFPWRAQRSVLMHFESFGTWMLKGGWHQGGSL